MGRVQEAIKKFWVKLSYLPALERYLETGDEGAYKKIKPSANDPSWWGNQLADILQPVEQWDDVDRRIVRALNAAGVEENLWQWVDKHLKHEPPTGDVFGAVRRELEGAAVNTHDIAVSTITFVHSLALNGRTTSAGRFILSLSEGELLRALKAVQKSKNVDRFTGSGALTELLTLAAPERVDDMINALLQPHGKASPNVAVVKPLLERTGEKGIDMYSDIKLGDAFFVKNDGVRIGSYTYDEPGNEDDPRLIPLGKVPPIVFSEVMGDLQKIAGKNDDAEADE